MSPYVFCPFYPNLPYPTSGDICFPGMHPSTFAKCNSNWVTVPRPQRLYCEGKRSEPKYAGLPTDRPRNAYSLLSTRVPTAWIKLVCKSQRGKLAKSVWSRNHTLARGLRIVLVVWAVLLGQCMLHLEPD